MILYDGTRLELHEEEALDLIQALTATFRERLRSPINHAIPFRKAIIKSENGKDYTDVLTIVVKKADE